MIMSEYTPDRWVIIKVSYENGEIENRVLASWYGGYLGSDSWKLGTGIQNHEKVGSVYAFTGSSGSTYHCHDGCYGMSSYTQSILTSFGVRGDRVVLLSEDEVKALYV